MKFKWKFKKFLRTAPLLLGPILIVSQSSASQNTRPAKNSQSVPAITNTNADQHDGNTSNLNADQPTRSDGDVSRDIRDAIHSDATLSSDAQKVKVETQNGRVTLKGTVTSEAEKQEIEAKAEALAGQGKVTSNLSVKPAN